MVFGALFTGRSGSSFLRSMHVSDDVGLLRVSPTHITIRSCFLRRYEFPKHAIQKLMFHEHRILSGIRLARLRIIHNLPDVPKYILFVACDPEELKTALSTAGFQISDANAGRESPRK
jgi:hypothetical protein